MAMRHAAWAGSPSAKTARIDPLREVGRHHLVGVEVEHPVVAALAFREALLPAVARPVVVDHPGAERGGERLGPVGRAGIDHHDVVGEIPHRREGGAETVGLVLDDDEDGDRERGHGT